MVLIVLLVARIFIFKIKDRLVVMLKHILIQNPNFVKICLLSFKIVLITMVNYALNVQQDFI